MKGVLRSIVIVSVSVILACLLVVSSIHVTRAGEPVPGAEITLEQYPEDDPVALLKTGSLDIWSGSLRSDQISQLTGDPSVTLASHVELGMCELDMNNQMWPTGDPNNKFYKYSSVQANKSLAFRRAVACLVDRDELVSSPQYFGGYAYRMDVPIPPAQSAYMDMANYTASGLIYDYNLTRAQSLLDSAGFTMLPSGLRQDPTTPGVALKPITFVIPQDDPRLLKFGQALTTTLRNIGIPVTTVIGPRTFCSEQVATYDYNLYIGTWSFDVAPTQYYDLYSSDNYYGPINGPSPNYVGFCNNGTLFGSGHTDAEGFDYWAWEVKYASTTDDAMTAARTAGYLFLRFCPVVPLLCQVVFQAYRTDLTGIINNVRYGIDNQATFSVMSNPTGTVINYGIPWDPAPINLNIITCGRAETEGSSLTGPAPKILSMMYDSLMVANPWTLGTECWLAHSYSVGSWNATAKGGDPDATYVNFTIRPDVYWHNNDTAGRSLDVYDVNFTFCFMKACSQGSELRPSMATSIVQSLKSFDHCNVDPATNTTCVYFLQKSAWALQWAGEIPIVNRDIWGPLVPLPNPPDPAPWEEAVRSYNPAIMDLNGNGLADLSEDGTGKCTYSSGVNVDWMAGHAISTQSRALFSTMNHYGINEEGVKSLMVNGMFHGAGDVNLDGVINVLDLGFMARAAFTNNSTGGIPGNWGAWNPACDLNKDGIIDANDLAPAAMNYGNAVSG